MAKVQAQRLSSSARKLLGLIPADGSFIGNIKLKRTAKLGNRFTAARRELIQTGKAIRGKGRGGSLARPADAPDTSEKPTGHVKKEKELYEPLKQWIEKEWGEDVEGDFFKIAITATARRQRRASGRWSRPDVTVVQVNKFDFLPEPIIEVTTFEVKKFRDAEKIESVYEAAAHSRWAHNSFLVAEVPSAEFEFSDRFMSELERFKIGLITMWKERKAWEFDQVQSETERLSPDPKELNQLLTTFLGQTRTEKRFKIAIGKA